DSGASVSVSWRRRVMGFGHLGPDESEGGGKGLTLDGQLQAVKVTLRLSRVRFRSSPPNAERAAGASGTWFRSPLRVTQRYEYLTWEMLAIVGRAILESAPTT